MTEAIGCRPSRLVVRLQPALQGIEGRAELNVDAIDIYGVGHSTVADDS